LSFTPFDSPDPMAAPALPVLLALVLCGLAIVDFRTFRLPNLITLPLLFLGWTWHSFAMEGAGLAWSLAGSVVSTLPLLWFYLRGKMGAGDVKLMAVVGAWLGGWTGLHVLVVSGIAGIACAGVMRLLSHQTTAGPVGGHSPDTSVHVETALTDPELRQRWIPFSVPITIGVLVMAFFPQLQSRTPVSAIPHTRPPVVDQP